MSFWSDVLATGVILAIPVLLAALGELIAERSGVLNIGLEGMLAVGAYVGFATMLSTHNVWLSAGAAMAGGIAVAAAMAATAVIGPANQIVAGFALFVMAPAVVNFIYAQRNTGLTSTLATSPLGTLKIPGLSSIPLVGKALFAQNGFYYATIVISVLVFGLLIRTRFGLEVAAAGHDPVAAEARGVRVKRVRTIATLCAGALAGLGGAALTVGAVGSFSPGVVGGRGFVAIAIVILGRWKVGWVVLAAGAIGFTNALQFRLSEKIAIPVEILGLLPWIVVLAMLVVGARLAVMPRALGRSLS